MPATAATGADPAADPRARGATSARPPRGGDNGFGSAGLDDFLERNRRRFGGGSAAMAPAAARPAERVEDRCGSRLPCSPSAAADHHALDRPGGARRRHPLRPLQLHAPPGVGFTLPSPIARVQKVNIEQIRDIKLGSAAEETLMLTGDQNIIDIAYQVRWSIRDPEQYLFELAQPEETIRQVAESAMRAVVAKCRCRMRSATSAARSRRGSQEEMQRTLDRYQAGVSIRASRSSRPIRRPRSTTPSRKSPPRSRTRKACQPGQRLCAPAAPEGAGRGDRVRQGL